MPGPKNSTRASSEARSRRNRSLYVDPLKAWVKLWEWAEFAMSNDRLPHDSFSDRPFSKESSKSNESVSAGSFGFWVIQLSTAVFCSALYDNQCFCVVGDLAGI